MAVDEEEEGADYPGEAAEVEGEEQPYEEEEQTVGATGEEPVVESPALAGETGDNVEHR